MANQRSFEQQHAADWHALRATLTAMHRRLPRHQPSAEQYARFPVLYSQVCNHLALARTRGYSPQLVESLNSLVLESYNQLYRNRTRRLGRALRFISTGFPRLVRKHKALFWYSSALLYLPLFLTGLACYLNADFVYRVHNAEQVASFEYMYEPGSLADFRPEDRDSASDFQMFGYYIRNNIGIDFRIFAGGILFGIGSVFFLIYNGLAIGAVAGHLTGIGYHETFWGFVAGHSAFELTAACISGMSGLIIGIALIKPGALSRAEALKKQSLIAVQLVIGAGLMTLAAAFIEAYWSSSTLPPGVKYVVGMTLWIITAAYLFFAGRNKQPSGHTE